jgi:adenylate kinase family enzyme
MKEIIFLTGASGVGKTTLLKQIKNSYQSLNNWRFEHFDSIGVPSLEEMKEIYGSPENWQRQMTFKWIKDLISKYEKDEIVVLEGQANIQFILDAFKLNNFISYKIILVDCNETIMNERLTHERKQPEFANENMNNWLKFLRMQAKDLSIDIIDNSNLTVTQAFQQFHVIIFNSL